MYPAAFYIFGSARRGNNYARDLFKGWAAPDIGDGGRLSVRTVYASATSMWKLNNSRYRKAHSALFIPDNNELVRQREYLLSTTGFHLRVLSRAPSLSFHSPSFRPSLRIHPPYLCPPTLATIRPAPLCVCDCQCLPRTYYRDDVAALWRSAEGKIVETCVSVCVWTNDLDFPANYDYLRGGECVDERVRKYSVKGGGGEGGV